MSKDIKEILEELKVSNTFRAIEKLKLEVDDEGYYITTDGSRFFNDEEAILHEVTTNGTPVEAEIAIEEKADEKFKISFYTTSNIDISIKDNLGGVFSSVNFGMHIGRDMLGALRNVFGGRMNSIDKVMREARREALTELQEKTISRGGNAVINVHFLPSAAGEWVGLMAYGDAVIIDKTEKG